MKDSRGEVLSIFMSSLWLDKDFEMIFRFPSPYLSFHIADFCNQAERAFTSFRDSVTQTHYSWCHLHRARPGSDRRTWAVLHSSKKKGQEMIFLDPLCSKQSRGWQLSEVMQPAPRLFIKAKGKMKGHGELE